MSVVDRMDDFQQRHPVVGFPIAVVYKFIDDQGAYLAALITYYGLLSLFPLLLLLVSALGFLVQGNEQLRQQVLQGVLAQIPVIGDELSTPHGLQGSLLAVIVGGLAAMYGGLGVAQAIQHAMNTCWAVPRHRRPNPFLARARSALLLLILGAALVGSAVLTRYIPLLPGWLVVAISTVLSIGVFWVLLHLSTASSHGWRSLLPGAVVVGVFWQALEQAGTALVGDIVARSGRTYGVFAVVLALIWWIYLLALCLVLAAELNVVWSRRLYPRALMTPFTDDVDLTTADQEAYGHVAQMQRLKGYERIVVTFDKDQDGIPDPPSDLARRADQAARAPRRRWGRADADGADDEGAPPEKLIGPEEGTTPGEQPTGPRDGD